MNKWISVLALWLLLWMAGCSDSGLRRFDVRGVVVSVEEDANRLVVNHEEIPGYMPRMVMPFNVRGNLEQLHLKRGDVIEFTYKVEERESWIEGIEIVGASELDDGLADALDSLEVSGLLEVGEEMRDYGFVGLGGSSVRLSDYRGDRLAITFIFSRCPVPEYCPRMMRNFSEVSRTLENGEAWAKNWRLFTVSFDPEYDSPEVLQAYGDSFGQRSDRWSMFTCEDQETLSSIAKDVGLKYGESNGTYLHNLRTVVLDEEGRLVEVFTDENWDPDELVSLLGKR